MLTESVKHATRIDEHGSIFWVATTIIEKDGKEVARTNHSTTIYPASDLTGVPEEVAAVARARWTPETVEAFTAKELAKHAEERKKIEDAIAEINAEKSVLEAKQKEVGILKTQIETEVASRSKPE